MSATPYMPIWVGDFLSKTAGLDGKEVGAYLLILMAMWSHGGMLPDDQKKLQRIARVGRDWPKVWGAISHYFDIENGQVFNSRLRDELSRVNAKREVNSHSGARGGAAKALKDKKQGLANATVSPQQSYSESYREKRTTSVVPKKPSPRDELEKVISPERANDVIEHRQRMRKPLTQRAALLLAGKLSQFDDPNKAADFMIEKGWQSIEREWVQNAMREARTRPEQTQQAPKGGDAFFAAAEFLRNERERRGEGGGNSGSDDGRFPVLIEHKGR